MENASKALVIAGGILLAMLTISLLFLLLSNINSSKMTEEEKLAAKQLQEFNQQWEAYNKKVLYGTDVISVVNKAIDNNKKENTTTTGEKYYVNVVINFKSEQFETEVIKKDKNTGEDEYVTLPITVDGTTIKNDQSTFASTLSLGRWDAGNYIENNTITYNFSLNTKYKEQYVTSDAIYYVTPAVKKFKTKVFRCTGINYVEGRVNQIEFEIK